jgi:hypothetical protein
LVDSLEDLAKIARALSEIEVLRRREWSKLWPSYHHRRTRDTHLVRFTVSSPPFTEVFTDPAWLAVLLMVLGSYEKFGPNARRIARDALGLLENVRGLTSRQIQLLEIAIRLSGERWAAAGERASLALARRFARIHKGLLGEAADEEEAKPPQIHVIDIANKEVPW